MRSQGLQWGLPEVFSVLYNPSSMSVNQYFQFIMGKEYIISYELNEILKTGICQLATSHSINWNSLRFGKSAYQEFFQLKLLLKYLNREDRETISGRQHTDHSKHRHFWDAAEQRPKCKQLSNKMDWKFSSSHPFGRARCKSSCFSSVHFPSAFIAFWPSCISWKREIMVYGNRISGKNPHFLVSFVECF